MRWARARRSTRMKTRTDGLELVPAPEQLASRAHVEENGTRPQIRGPTPSRVRSVLVSITARASCING
jgi:hypothetical protein